MTRLLKYPKCLLSVAIVMVGVIVGIVCRNDLWGVNLLGLTFIPLPAVVALIFSLIALGMFLWRRRISKFLKYGLAIGWSSVLSVILFIVIPNWINDYKVHAVERYVARAVPILDQIRQKRGTYPEALPIDILGQPPELLRDYGKYSSTRSSFHIEYTDEPAEWACGGGPFEFDSETREWRYN